MNLKFKNASIRAIATCVPPKLITLDEQVDTLYGGDVKKLQRIKKSTGLNQRHITDQNIVIDGGASL